MEGTEFGRYRLLDLLGRGGMGEVWRARDTLTNRVVALKVLLAQFANDPTFQQRFLREAQTAAALNEPHIVPIHNYGEIDGRLFVDMRLIEGQDLQELLESGPLAVSRAVRIIEQVAMALEAAHEVGLVHRDVKPSNVRVAKFDFTYLIDFGIARTAADAGLTGTGNTIGTWHYMAPERFNTGQAGTRSDVYALACVLHECLTGARPFPGDSMQQQITGHLMSPPPRPSEARRELSPAFDEVIARGMAKDPNDRYPTAIALARAALAAADTPTAAADPTTGRYRPLTPAPRAATTSQPPGPHAPQPYPTPPPIPYPTPPPARYPTPMPYPTPQPPSAAPTGGSKRSRTPLVIGGAIVAVIAVVAAIIGVVAMTGSSGRDEPAPSSTVRAQVPRSPDPTSTDPTTATTEAPAPGEPQPTIATYIADNGITETAVRKGDPGAPVIGLPVPAGWAVATSPPEWAYDAIVSTDAAYQDDPPAIFAIMSKLEGADAEQLLAHAPGELMNLLDYQGGTGESSELDGYSAVVLAGTFTGDNGAPRSIAQKTVVIPASDEIYVLQLNANGPEGAQAILDAATATVDAETTITF
ncbi:protein kinase domain-containing protein [Mycolicibacterium arenosum]|uniref:non-specific serine/threonine protein kinase n=1 Tax=Mycolicibacterium arenosum TaxID=2952157 RepID=A0ABT1LWT1_9MYCO|nr:LpqN/LpqT family lipoprotein [Mycolicibacterium sp. CAU 1645]MCP9271351.1 LpqN/LpqT family lipoprotein [Mycolicibacterium sp. CAU 1645]